MIQRLPTLSLLAALASACVPAAHSVDAPRGAAATPLDGTAWTADTLGPTPALPRPRPSMRFEAGALSGSDGCNRYAGTYRDGGDGALTVAPGRSTMMACPEPVMAQARAFLETLAATRAYTVDGTRLVLRDGAGAPLATFTRQATTLAGTRWTATAVNNGRQAVTSLVAGTTVTAAFGADGTLTGTAGCNRYSSAYTTDGAALAIRPAALTRRACPAPILEQEQQYVAALGATAMYRIDGDRLELRSASGALQVSYERAPAGGE
jgi:heat shock protein HslJ